jgi:hypothetical protein
MQSIADLGNAMLSGQSPGSTLPELATATPQLLQGGTPKPDDSTRPPSPSAVEETEHQSDEVSTQDTESDKTGDGQEEYQIHTFEEAYPFVRDLTPSYARDDNGQPSGYIWNEGYNDVKQYALEYYQNKELNMRRYNEQRNEIVQNRDGE